MKKNNFMQLEKTYKKGTYTDYKTSRALDLYVRNRDKDGDNEIIKVIKETCGTVRMVSYVNIAPVIKDNLIKDLCAGLILSETKQKQFNKELGTAVNLESLSIDDLTTLVNKYSYKDAHTHEVIGTNRNITKEQIKGSQYLFRENEGEISLYLMPTRAGKKHNATSVYQVSEKTPGGQIITKTMSANEFRSLGKVAKESDYVSNRFAQNSSYVALANAGVIANNNGPAETVLFKIKLKNLIKLHNITDTESDE